MDTFQFLEPVVAVQRHLFYNYINLEDCIPGKLSMELKLHRKFKKLKH